jgi:hypothetical protein
VRKTAGYTWTDYKTNMAIAKEQNITPNFGQSTGIQKKKLSQLVNRLPRNRLPRIINTTDQKAEENRGGL